MAIIIDVQDIDVQELVDPMDPTTPPPKPVAYLELKARLLIVLLLLLMALPFIYMLVILVLYQPCTFLSLIKIFILLNNTLHQQAILQATLNGI